MGADIPINQQQRRPNASQCWSTDDIVLVTTKQLTTTGGTLWNAALRCRDFLEATAEHIGLHKQGVRVLELGAGCGTLGLTVARNTPGAAEVCLTEQAYGGALQHLQLNVLANAHLPHMGSVTCCACDWTHMEPAMVQAAIAAAAGGSGSGMAATPDSSAQEQTCSSDTQKQQQAEPGGSSVVVSQQELLDLHKLVTTPWDIIIGSDLIYNTAGAHALPRVLATLMHAQPPPTQQQQELLPPRPPNCNSSSSAPDQSANVSVDLPPQQQQSEPAQPAGPVMYYAHTKHRYDAMDVLLFERLAAEGLTVEEVVEPGKELPPPSPPPFSSLYPDMRCAVFKIYRAAS